MAVGEIVAGAIQGLGSVGLDIYNAWRTQKNQEIQWNREDSAIQRQVKDAEKAGFNKWAVLGNSGASSTTSTSAGTIDRGSASSAVDALNAMYTLARERSEARYQDNIAKISNNNKEISDNQLLLSNWQTSMQVANMMRDAGFDFDGFVLDNPYQMKKLGLAWTGNPAYPGSEQSKSKSDSLFNLEYDANYQSTRASAEQNKITGDLAAVSGVIKILQGLFGTVRDVGSAYRSFKGHKK